jgi:phage protein D
MPAATLVQASARFGHFYVPRFELEASGTNLDPAVLHDVMRVSYTDSISEIDSFDLTVNNWDAATQRLKYVGAEQNDVQGDTSLQRLFNPGAAEFELRMGYGSELATMMKGSTTSLEPSFPGGGAPTLTVRALNVLHKLRTRQHRDHWPNSRVARGRVKISRIAQDIGQRRNEGGCRFPLRVRIDENALAREPVLDYVAQDNQCDIDFLLAQARLIGYVVYIGVERLARGRTREVLHFGPSEARAAGAPEAIYELKWGASLMDFTPRLSTANQVRSVTVRSWNRETNRRINERITLDASGLRVNEDLWPLLERRERCLEREEIVVDEPQFTEAQARRRATALLSDRLKQMVEAEGTTVGLPDLRAGQRVRIVGLGRRFSGEYFVTKTTHTIDDGGYQTKFTARREAGLPAPAQPPQGGGGA